MTARRDVAIEPAEVARRLPHRHPFLLLDRVDDLEVGVSAVGTKNISITEDRKSVV